MCTVGGHLYILTPVLSPLPQSSLITNINSAAGFSPLPSILNSPLLDSLVSASPNNAQLAAMFQQLAQSTRGTGGQTPAGALLDLLTPGPGTAGAWPDSTRSGGGTLRQLLDLQDGDADFSMDEANLADALLSRGFFGLPSARRPSVTGGVAGPAGARDGGEGEAGGGSGAAGDGGELSAEQLVSMGLQSPSTIGVGGGGQMLYKGVHFDKEQNTWQVVVFDGTRFTVVGEYTNELEALVANELLSPAQPMPNQGNINTLLAGTGSGDEGPGAGGNGGQGQEGQLGAESGPGDAGDGSHGGAGFNAGRSTPSALEFLNRLTSGMGPSGGPLSPNAASLSPLFAALSPAGGGFTALLLPTPREPGNASGASQLMPPSPGSQQAGVGALGGGNLAQAGGLAVPSLGEQGGLAAQGGVPTSTFKGRLAAPPTLCRNALCARCALMRLA